MRLLVTGASGFIGGAVARRATELGCKVGLVHRGRPAESPGSDKAGTWEEWAARPASRRFDALVHSAAVRHRHGVSPAEYVGVNLELTRKAIELARRHAKRLVLVSSVAVYGDPSQLPVDEMSPLDPVGPYGRSKIESEDAVRDSGLPFVIVQPSITYGPGDTNGMMEKILRMVAARFFVVPGLGRSRVQLIYIDDVANALLTACEAPAAIGSRFICTYRDPIAMADLVRLSGRAVGTWIPPIGPPVALLKAGASALDALDAAGFFRGREPPLTREKLATVAVDHAYRIDRMRQVLGFEPAIGYEEGFRRTAQALGLGPGMR